MRIALVNLNLVKVPAIAPYAIDVISSALCAAEHNVEILDLCKENEPLVALRDYFSSHNPDLTALSMRNAVDLYLPSLFDLPDKGSFIGSHAKLVEEIKSYVDPRQIIIGGIGFSVNPHAFLKRLGLRYGAVGPGRTCCAN